MTSKHRRHFGCSSRACRPVMESLAETETETDGENETTALVEAAPPNSVSKIHDLLLEDMATDQVGCTPFFGVKHYLNDFYGLKREDNATKPWQQIEKESQQEELLSLPKRRNHRYCTPINRLCFAYLIALGILISLMGICCLLLGHLLPRHQILVGKLEEEDLKMWITSSRHPNVVSASAESPYPHNREYNLLDKNAIEYNNILDLLKITGLVAICFGCLIIVSALICPNCQHSSNNQSDYQDIFLEEQEDDPENSSQVSQALRNCLRSFPLKNQSTVFYSGLITANHQKIPVIEQVKSVQP